jgi:hypothetical protein
MPIPPRPRYRTALNNFLHYKKEIQVLKQKRIELDKQLTATRRQIEEIQKELGDIDLMMSKYQNLQEKLPRMAYVNASNPNFVITPKYDEIILTRSHPPMTRGFIGPPLRILRLP